MRSVRCGRVIAFLLCLVMIASQLGMTSFDGAEEDHDPVLVQDTAAPGDGVVPGEPAADTPETAEQPADGAQAEEEPGLNEGGPGDDLSGDDGTAGGVLEDTAPAGDEETEDNGEPEASDEPEASKEPETGDEPETSEEPEGEKQSEEDGHVAVTMALDMPAPIAAPRASAPTITVAMPEGQTKTDGFYYCSTPVVTVRGTGAITVTVNGDAQQTLHDGESVVLGAGTEQGWGVRYDITATNEGGTASKSIFVGHTMEGRSIIEYEPTCTEAGRTMTYWKCGNCGQYWNGYSGSTGEPALGHTHDKTQEQVLAGECGGSGGVKVAPCTRCGVLVKEDDTEYKDEGASHEWVEKTRDATCTKSGYKYKECAKCHAQVFIEKINATGHQLGKWEMESLAGKKCGDTVTETLSCKNCDYKMTRKTQIQHQWANVRTEIKKATCTEQGQTGFACTREGCTAATGILYTPALGHNYSETHDCTEPGTCSVCGEQAPARNHVLEYQSNDTQHWQVCTNTGCEYETAPEDHSNAHAGDCTKTWRCSLCQHSVTGKANHSWEWVDLGDGTHQQKCTNENCTQVQKAGAHNWDNPGDCTKDKTCQDCGATQPAEKEHSYGPWSKFTTYHRRSCTNPGCTVQQSGDHEWEYNKKDCTANVTCSVCGEVLLFGALNHNFTSSPWYPDEDGGGHHQKCENNTCEAVSPSQAHTGGTATCQHGAICEVCHTEYTAKDPSNHESRELVGYEPATSTEPGYSGDIMCTHCNTVLERGAEIPSGQQSCPHDNVVSKYDDNGSWEECTNCHAQLHYKPHVFNGKYLSDGDEHWQQCENCQHTTAKAPHVLSGNDYDNNCMTPVECDVCGKVLVEAKTHQFDGAWVLGWTGSGLNARSVHARACSNDDCKEISGYAEHTAKEPEDNDCTTPVVCGECGYEIVKAQEHVWDEVWHHDEATRPGVHYQQCLNLEGKCTEVKDEPHQPLPDDGDCTTPVLCAVCGAVVVKGETEHDFGGAYLSDETGHWQVCQNPGCERESQEKDHTGGTATCVEAAVCDECGRRYGEPDPANHVGGEEIVGHVNPTLEAPGYSGDVRCLSCGQVKTYGSSLEQLDEHQAAHVWSEYKHDSVRHWKECTGGCGTWSEEEPHKMTWTANGAAGHKGVCVCGLEAEEEHTFTVKSDKNGHWDECVDCGYKTEAVAHTWDGSGVCTVCGAEKPAAGGAGTSTGEVPASPKTGDETPLALYAGLLGLCAGTLALVMIRRRKEQ